MSGGPKTDRSPRGFAWLLVVFAAGAMLVLLGLPLAAVFGQALAHGVGPYFAALTSPDTLAAFRLSAIAVAFAVPLNTLFGLCAAWAITKHDFPGKSVLVSIIDIPFTVSPVVAGLLFVLLFGARGVFGAWLVEHGLRIVYATPGIVIATAFVTSPFVVRELLPLMTAQSAEEELAAATLGAGGWQTFFRITLPNIKWALLYGVLLCTARALGEFGAVSVLSGHVRGETNTIPLHVEILYNDYDQVGAFAVASTLALFGLVGLVLKRLLGRKSKSEQEAIKAEAAA